MAEEKLKIIKGGGDKPVEVTPPKLHAQQTEAEKLVADKRKKQEEGLLKKREEEFKRAFNAFLDDWMNKRSQVQQAQFVFNMHLALQEQGALVQTLLVEVSKLKSDEPTKTAPKIITTTQ